MAIQGISSALLGPAADPHVAVEATAAANYSAKAADVAEVNQKAATSSVPPNATATIYNAKGFTSQVGAVPSPPHK